MFTVTQIKSLTASGEIHKFYNDTYWRKLSHEIIKEQHGECQFCRSRGRVTPAILVHHVLELKDNPELAYERWQDKAHTKRQLLALCQQCHEEQHPNRFGQERTWHYTNKERW